VSIPSALRSRLVAVRDWVDGRLHAKRRRQAIDRLVEMNPRSVLFVCLGNVCRSPYAKWSAEARLDGASDAPTFDSAGFIGPDRPPPDRALAAARGRGIDHESHRSKTLDADLVNEADLVVIFDRGNLTRLRGTRGARTDHVLRLGDLDPTWTGKRAIIDPWGKADEEFERTFDRIDRCLDVLLEASKSK
jgi:protein-tyrosine phosphatase